MTTDPVGVITDVDEPMELLTGRRRAELISSPFNLCFTEPERAEEGIGLRLREGVFAAARDVTEYKLLKEQPPQSEAYNRGLIEASVDGLITVSASGEIMDVNADVRLSGFGRKTLVVEPPAYGAEASLRARS